MNLRPYGNKIIVKPDVITDSFIALPDIAKPKEQTGTVIAAGNQCRRVSQGCKVIYSQYGRSVNDRVQDIEGNLIMPETNVYAVLV